MLFATLLLSPENKFDRRDAKKLAAEFAWLPPPISRNRAPARTNSDARPLDRGDAELPDDPPWRIPCGAPSRIADKPRPILPCAHRGGFSQGWTRRRWKCYAHRP